MPSPGQGDITLQREKDFVYVGTDFCGYGGGRGRARLNRCRTASELNRVRNVNGILPRAGDLPVPDDDDTISVSKTVVRINIQYHLGKEIKFGVKK